MERALTVPQVAERLSVHPKTVYNMLVRGELRGVKVGRVWRVPAEELEVFLRGERTAAEGRPAFREYTRREIRRFLAADKVDEETARKVEQLLQ
ncbi:MAG: helix-turn-helix domain-containing protein [Anaerolineae bacterium]